MVFLHLPLMAAESMEGCSQIENEVDRLSCYDKFTKAAEQSEQDRENTSAVEKRLRSEYAVEDKSFVITPYRRNYFLFYTYDQNPNQALFDQVEPGTILDNEEAKFQISFRFPIAKDVLDDNSRLYFGYTQLSLWQVYQSEISSPFRESNYEPEFWLSFLTDYEFLGMHGRLIDIGVNHQSNGRGDPLSRSWNRVFLRFIFEKGNYAISFRAYKRIDESSTDDDNPEITKYLGWSDIRLAYKHGDSNLGLMFRNNFRSGDDNYGAVQLDWSFPVSGKLKGYVQYFNGYGESLLDYNHRTNRIGIGFLLTDLL